MESLVIPTFAVLSVAEMVIIGWLYNKVRLLRKADHGNAIINQSTGATQNPPFPTAHGPRMRTLSDKDNRFMERLTTAIMEEMGHGKVEVEQLTDRMCISRSQLNRRVNAITGMSTSNYSIQLRLQCACKQLREQSDVPVAEIAFRCGFDDAAYFARIFKRRLGTSPSAYRKNNTHESGDLDLNHTSVGLSAQNTSL